MRCSHPAERCMCGDEQRSTSTGQSAAADIARGDGRIPRVHPFSSHTSHDPSQTTVVGCDAKDGWRGTWQRVAQFGGFLRRAFLAGSLDRPGSAEDESGSATAAVSDPASQSLDVTGGASCSRERLLAAPFGASTLGSALAAFYADRLLAIAERSVAHRVDCRASSSGYERRALVRRPLTPLPPALGCSAHRVPQLRTEPHFATFSLQP
ncbi:uncharacterized protein PSANT_06592 [Moesziomyces antarcticus]|uniref:Uncharacterized protein n=1 Tax=Pseudozyma antarctica TaxID=84753 RepID=A0A5C3FYS5_PSEA2|nr:uncharacterized protein PSANT_06592 [Moesziomyces antarcticus]